MLTEEHNKNHMGTTLSFLEYYGKICEFDNHIMTSNKTWIAYYTPQTKHQSKEWHHSKSLKNSKKFKQTPSNK